MSDDLKRPGWPADPPPKREELERTYDATLRLQEQRAAAERTVLLVLTQKEARALRDTFCRVIEDGLTWSPCDCDWEQGDHDDHLPGCVVDALEYKLEKACARSEQR